MKVSLAILIAACAVCPLGCASLFHDPLLAAYESGEISKEEYDKRTLETEESLARTSPAYWERKHTEEQNRAELKPD